MYCIQVDDDGNDDDDDDPAVLVLDGLGLMTATETADPIDYRTPVSDAGRPYSFV